MLLSAGSRIGPYEVLSPLGAGGMGEVYRAKDLKLGRDVAIKIVPEAFASDPDRLARFQREAQVLASLNHPNIAAIYGLEDGDGTKALILELVPGETLADRIARGPISLDEALPIAKQIAEALEAAHEQGIIHRDLKPANIKITPDGVVKVLDFGLAKLAQPASTTGMSPLSMSPTITSPAMMTKVGVLLGTAPYMSPEQAKGREADKRSDVWAFGCVFYEMLTGKRAFDGEDVAETLAGVLKGNPDWARLPAAVPQPVRRLLHWCLIRDRLRRLSDFSAIRLEMAEADNLAPVRSTKRLRWSDVSVVLATVLALSLAAFLYVQRPVLSQDVVRFGIAPPPGTVFTDSLGNVAQALSPDGRMLVFATESTGGKRQLWVRTLDAIAPRELPGTDGAEYVFWSPDGQNIGFLAQGQLKRLRLRDGAVATVSNAQNAAGASWSSSGWILFGTTRGPIFRVRAAGGTPEPLTRLVRSEWSHQWPEWLPDGNHYLYFVGGDERNSIVWRDVTSDRETVITSTDSRAIFVPPSTLIFARASNLLAQQFVPSTGTLTGEPRVIAEGVSVGTVGNAAVSVTSNALSFRPVAADITQFMWVDRQGRTLSTLGDPEPFVQFRLSRDGTKIAVQRERSGPRAGVWVMDAERGAATPLTSGQVQAGPVWTPDGRAVSYTTVPDRRTIYTQALDGRMLSTFATSIAGTIAEDWSPDGKYLLVVANGLRIADVRTKALTVFAERLSAVPGIDEPVFSPDGRTVAYMSGESGRAEVYLKPFPGPGERVNVSVAGGTQPKWRADGKELFFLAMDGTLMAVDVDPHDAFKVGTPRTLFKTPIRVGLIQDQYAPSGDGTKFLLLPPVPGQTQAPISVTLNWQSGLSD